MIVDPDAQQVMGSMPMGYRPDIALSRDGTRMYVAHSVPVQDQDRMREVIDIIDTGSGTTLHRVDSPNRWISTLPAYWSQLALSDDGRLLFQMKAQIRDRFYTEYFIETLDLERNVFLPERAAIPMCITGVMLPQPGQRSNVGVLCSRTEDLRLLNLSETGAVRNQRHVAMSPSGSAPAATAFYGPNGSELTAIVPRGEFVRVEVGSGEVSERGVVDRAGRRPVSQQMGPSQGATRRTAHDPNDWLAGRWIRLQPPMLTTDKRHVVLGVGELEDKRRGRESYRMVAILDAASLDRVADIKLSRTAWGMTMSRDGRRLYTFDASIGEPGGTMTVVDVAAGRELNTMSLGVTPTYAVEAP